MGQHAELMAQEWKITARRAGPARATRATSKAAEAYRSGYMDDLIVPFAGVSTATTTCARTSAWRSWRR